MDLCTLEEAFPNIHEGSLVSPTPYVGGKDAYSSREERRAARKRAKKAKGPALTYSNSITEATDPDRPAVERMKGVDSIQQQKEAFALPVLPKASCLFSDTGIGGSTNYFGKSEDDVEEPFSSFTPSPTDDANYRLYPDFTKSDTLKGAAKAAGAILPEPPLADDWKPMTPAASYTAFFDELPQNMKVNTKAKVADVDPDWAVKAQAQGSYSNVPGPVGVNDTLEGKSQDALLKRIDELMGRLDQLEKKNVKDSQTEILMFVGTGLFLLMSFEIFGRR